MLSNTNKGLTYADAGVDIDASNKAVELMKDSVKATYRPEVLGDLGGFGGLGGAHGHTGRRLSTIARRLQGGEQLGLAHGRRAAQAHLFSELFELRQLHILKILAICHWLPFPYRTDPCLSRR